MPDFDTLLERASAAQRRSAEATAAVTHDLASQRLSYSSPDNLVTVVVDGNGSFQDLTIAPGTVRGAHPQLLAGSIQTALNAARRAALTRRSKLVAEKLEQA